MRRWLGLLAILGSIGCSGDGGGGGGTNPGEGIEGGGVTGDALGGEIEVHVTDARTHQPIAGAEVRVGPGMGATSGEGVTVVTDASFTAPQNVDVTASGYAGATWIGVARANVTIPLTPLADPERATASGTIDGWGDLPAPSDFNDYNLGLVLATFTDDLGAPENRMDQPLSENRPLNTCLQTVLDDSCAWTLATRTGEQLHYAVLVRGNAQGTFEDLTDDTYTLIGYAVGQKVTLAAGETRTDEHLTRVDASTAISVSFPAAPSGLERLHAFPMLVLPDGGRLVVPVPPVTPASASHMLPAAEGPLSGGQVEVVVTANPSGTAELPFSTAFARDVSGGSVSPGALPPPPSGISGQGSWSFTPMAGASLHFGEVRDGGRIVLTVVILDGSSTFTSSAVPASVSGSPELRIVGTELAGFDPNDFTLPDVTAGFTRAAGAAGSVSL